MISARQDAVDGGAVALKRDPPVTGETPAPVMPQQARPLGLWHGREGGLLDAADFAGVHLREAEALAAEVFQQSANEIALPSVASVSSSDSG